MTLLRSFYETNPKPDREQMHKLAKDIGQTFKVVKTWFQNSRARDRRGSNDSSSSLARQFPNTVFGHTASPETSQTVCDKIKIFI